MTRCFIDLRLAASALAASALAASARAASVFLAAVLAASALAHAGPPVFIADLNGRYGSDHYHDRVAEAVAAIILLQPEAVVIAGDMIAGQARPPLPESRIDAMWATFDRVVYQPLHRAGIRVLAVPGNHDASIYPAFSHERRAYEAYWRPRAPAAMSGDSRFPWYYSVDLDAGRFVGLDVTAPGVLSEAQEAFLARQRQTARSVETPLLVATHLPMYPVSVGRRPEVFSAVAEPGPGEIWVSGHHHAYYAGVNADGGLQLSLPPLGGNRRAWLGGDRRGPFGFVGLTPENAPVLYAWPGMKAADVPGAPLQIGRLRRLDQPPQ